MNEFKDYDHNALVPGTAIRLWFGWSQPQWSRNVRDPELGLAELVIEFNGKRYMRKSDVLDFVNRLAAEALKKRRGPARKPKEPYAQVQEALRVLKRQLHELGAPGIPTVGRNVGRPRKLPANQEAA